MQQKLPKLVLAFLIILIASLLAAIFLIGKKTNPTGASQRIFIQSSISGHNIGFNDRLEKELNNVGFWNAKLRSDVTPQKINIYIKPLEDKNALSYFYAESDENGEVYLASSYTIDPDGTVNENIFLTTRVFGFKDPTYNISSAFWRSISQMQGKVHTEDQASLVKSALGKGSYFVIQ